MKSSAALALSKATALANAGLELKFQPDELYRVPTEDHASIALGRYHPRGPRRFAEPVLLCHGLGANRFAVDFNERYSLARYLARRGFESWVVELRGRGLSGSAGDCTFDEQAHYDVGAAIRTVVSTGAPAVSWVGHSKGGLLSYAHLARNPSAPVRALVTVGSPVTFAVQPGLKAFISTIDRLLSRASLPVGSIARSVARLGLPPGPWGPYLLLAENVEPDIIKRAAANMGEDIPGGVGRQFAHWVRTGRFDSVDGSIDYRQEMANIRIPVLMMAGSRDLLAPPLAVARAQELVSGPVKLVVAGVHHGFSADYGHGDLLLGRRAPDEVFPVVESFLSAHSTAL